VYFPAAQGWQEGEAKPLNLPVGQVSHEVTPLEEYIPASQLAQVALAGKVLYFPAGQSVHEPSAAKENLPAAQSVHTDTPLSLTLPATQLVHLGAAAKE
jgi:hypothetical protein